MSNLRHQDHSPRNTRGESSKGGIMGDVWKAVLFVSWMGGIVIAEGGLKIFAIIIPFYAWYLFVERVMKTLGLI